MLPRNLPAVGPVWVRGAGAVRVSPEVAAAGLHLPAEAAASEAEVASAVAVVAASAAAVVAASVAAAAVDAVPTSH